ncbi:MAG: hypothetical protein HFF02_05745 [Erysipelotrichaceae bacterium]|nr:hypothetical protein [Erysipelotrichaceae bacterium]
MSVSNKVKALLQLSDSNLSNYAKATNQSQQNVSNKVVRNTWTVQDFLKIAKHTNKRLAFVDEDNTPVVIFDNEDLKSE